MPKSCPRCPPRGVDGHPDLAPPEPSLRADGVRVLAFRCILCGRLWGRYYEGGGDFVWREVGPGTE